MTVPGKRTWPGLPEAELKLIWECANLHHAAREEQTNKSKTKMAASSSRKKLASQAGRMEECGVTAPTEVACSRKQSAAHEAVTKTRDKAFQVGCQFRGHYTLYHSQPFGQLFSCMMYTDNVIVIPRQLFGCILLGGEGTRLA